MQDSLTTDGDFRIERGAILLPYHLAYRTPDRVPIATLTDALLGFEYCALQSLRSLSILTGAPRSDSLSVFVEELHAGSLWGDFLMRVFTGTDAERDEIIAQIRQKLGVKRLMENDKAIAILATAMLTYGAVSAVRVFSKPSPAGIHLENIHNSVILTGAGTFNVTPREFASALGTGTNAPVRLMKHASRALGPARGQPGSRVELGLDAQTVIDADSVAAIPPPDAMEADTRVVDYQNVKLHIRASDVDSGQRGWAAKAEIDDIEDRRLPMKVSEDIAPRLLMYRESIRGNISVEYKATQKGWIPRRIELRSVVTEHTN